MRLVHEPSMTPGFSKRLAEVVARRGPARFTLADVASEVGLSAATLVQRFGSKRGLILALARSARDSVDACFALVRAAHPSPLAAVLAAGTEMTRYVNSPEEMSNHLAFLQTDLSDPDFYAVMLENSQRILAGYRTLLDEAVTAGELVPCDTARLARAVDALAGGSLIGWAVYRQGKAEAWVRDDLQHPARAVPAEGQDARVKAYSVESERRGAPGDAASYPALPRRRRHRRSAAELPDRGTRHAMSLYAESSAVLAWLLDDAVGSRVSPFERSTRSIWPRRSSRGRPLPASRC